MWHDHHSAKETGQQKEQWGWRLEAAGKEGGGGSGQTLKKGVGNIGGLHKVEGVRSPLPTMLYAAAHIWDGPPPPSYIQT